MPIQTGGSAYPYKEVIGESFVDGVHIPYHVIDHPGLTIRDHFAGLAMSGMLANGQRIEGDDAVQKRARYAYIMADALLQERSKS